MDTDRIAQNIVAADAVKFSFSYFDEGESAHNQNNVFITWHVGLDNNITIEDLMKDCEAIKESIDKNYRHMALKFPSLFPLQSITKLSKGDFYGDVEITCKDYEQVKEVIAEMKKLGWRGA